MQDWNWRRMRERHGLAAAAPRPDARFDSRWTLVDGVAVHCRATRRDPPGKTPVLLVHGMAVSHRYLMPLAARLAPRYPVRAVDLPGYGLSGDPGAVLDVRALADRLAAWLEATGEGPVAVVANSFGTQISVSLAAGHPHLLRSLVLVGPTMDPAARTRIRQMLRWLRGLPNEDPSQLPIILRDVADAGLRRAWRTFGIALEHRVERDLPNVRVPTLVTRGSKEAVASQRWVREVVRLLPQGEMAVVPGSPHDATYTSPTELADLVLPFLDRTLVDS
jgi:pimeloyl-ACP methyl ester carboxylesterase